MAWGLTPNRQPVANTTMQHVTRDDILDPNVGAQIKEFDRKLIERLDDTNFILMPGNANFAFSIKYDDFATPYVDPAYGENTPTYAQYGLMATEF